METIVRSIRADDLDALVELCRHHAQYEHATFEVDGQMDRWRDAFFGGPPKLHGWVAAEGDIVVGYMTATVDYATWTAQSFTYMDCLYIEEAYRGRGVGGQFIEELRKFAVSQGCSSAEWQTPADNESGIAFYLHLGADAKHKARFSYQTNAQDVL